MTKYIALLRGINVGGKNKISMSELKFSFEQRNFKNVITYINSGNILFESSLTEVNEIKTICEDFILSDFGLSISVGIILASELSNAIAHAPEWWNKDDNSKHNAIFVLPPMTTQKVLAEVGSTKAEYEKVDFYQNVIFWSAPISTFSKTRWSKIVQNKNIYNHITIRNANTTLKLLALAAIKP